MKLFLILSTILFTSIQSYAQVYLKTEYIGSSKFRDADNNETGGKGDAKIFSGGVQIPLSVKMNENNHPTAWGIGLGGSYTSFGNKRIPNEQCPSDMVNAQLTFTHLRPISKNWSILAALGAGAYTTDTDLSKVSMRNVLGHGGLIFIWHLRDNLDLGMGAAVNTSFGYPMAFPAIYLNWELRGRYEVKIQMMNAFEVSAGMNMHKNFKLSIIGEMGGSLALEKINGKKMMFTHQYMIAGLRPEFVFGKSFSIPVTLGISALRPAFYTERSLSAFFKEMGREHDPHFPIAPYASVAFKYKF